MIRFISGSAGSGKGAFIVDRIRERLDSGKKMYLIVPEQEAVLWEARICRSLPAKSALSLEIVSFKRLANTVARSIGGLTYNYAGDGKKTLLMWSAIASVYDSLKVYGSNRGREDTYIPIMLDTVGELKINRISPSMLEAACGKLEGGRSEGLKNKLHDISLIYQAYAALGKLDECQDPDNILENLAEVLRGYDFFKGCDVFIDSFYSLTPVEIDITESIMKSADDVFITFTIDHRSNDIHFRHIKKYYSKLLSLASLYGGAEKICLDEDLHTQSESIKKLKRDLWNFSAAAENGDGNVKIITCEDRYEEARAVGSTVERLIHEGASYSDIAVVARDIEKLRGILDSRLETLGIPFHLSKRYDITSTPAVKLVTSLLLTVSTSLSRESVISCIKTGLCGIGEREGACFEEYTSTWNLRGRKAYLGSEVWSMNPAGFTDRTSEFTKTVLIDANNVKEKIAPTLSKMQEIFDGGYAKVTDIAKTIYSVLEDLDVFSALEKDTELLDKAGRTEEARANEKIYSLILDALDLMVDTIPDATLDAGRFSRLFTAVAASFDTGAIPAGYDVVTLGGAYGVRCSGIKHVIIPGCIEGEFPMTQADTGLFSDNDRAELACAGVVLSSNTKELCGEELFRFWKTATMASESVTLIVPLSDSGKPASPSIGAKRIKKLLNITPENYSERNLGECIWSAAGVRDRAGDAISEREYEAIKELAKEFPEIGDVSRMSGSLTPANDSVSQDIIKEYREISQGGKLPLTQTRIDSFSKCRFSYYMKFILNLDEPQKASIGVLDVGNMIHRVLELFFTKTRKRDFPLEKEETERIVDSIIGDYLFTVMNKAGATPKQKYLFSRLRSNVLLMVNSLMEEFAQSKFRPYRFELPLGYGDSEKPLPLEFAAADGTKAYLYGTIDRVDTYEKDGNVFVRVVDYKTGSKTFKASDIKKGLNLQLLIYLFTIWKGGDSEFRRNLAGGGEILPAGMLYFSAAPDSFKSSSYLSRGEAENAAKKSISRTGLLLADEDVLSAMDRDLSGKYIPTEKKTKNPENKVLRTLEEFSDLYEETRKVIENIADEMNGGDCRSTFDGGTAHGNCIHCTLRPICRHTAGKEENNE